MAALTFRDPRFLLRTSLALALANARYWTTVAPTVRRELRRWHERAATIDDPALRALALAKLEGESFHAQAAAMLATSVRRNHRRDVAQAIVPLELLFDYLDGLTERPSPDPLAQGDRVFVALLDAVTVAHHGTGKISDGTDNESDRYLEDLSRAVSTALARLPAASAITQTAQRTAARSALAQTRMHAAAQLGTDQVEQWARAEARGGDLGWRELLAGAAASVLVLHALIAAAADPATTSEHALEIEHAYMPMATLLTLIDGLVDHDADAAASTAAQPGYIDVYSTSEELCAAIVSASDLARSAAARLRPAAHHTMMLFGLAAYYTTAPGAHSNFARPTCERLQDRLRPGIGPALIVMRAWRLGRRRSAARRPQTSGAGLASPLGQSRIETGGSNET